MALVAHLLGLSLFLAMGAVAVAGLRDGLEALRRAERVRPVRAYGEAELPIGSPANAAI